MKAMWFCWSFSAPEQIEVVSESAKYVTLKDGRRRAKTGDDQCVRDTKDDCWDWRVKRYEARVRKARESLAYENRELGKLLEEREAST